MIELPASLSKTYWDKKKGIVPAGSDLESSLKNLEKKHAAIDWKQFEGRWAESAKTADELDKLLGQRTQAWRVQVLTLKAEATIATNAAQKAAKGAGKPLLDAVRTISDAAKDFGKEIDKGLPELEAAAAKARQALLKSGGEEDGEAEQAGDPKQLLSMLQRCKRDPAVQMHYAFVAGDGKEIEPVLVLSPRVAGRMLFTRLVQATDSKVGTFGMASVDGTVLRLTVDKPYSGIVKKVRIPIKACGFRIAVVQIVGPDGADLESDHEEDGGQAGSGDSAAQTTGAANAGANGDHAASGDPGAGNAAAAGEHALAQWTAAREQAIATLKEVAREIAGAREPEADKAIIAISAVVKNLTVRPTDPARVKELIHYIDKDAVVLDVSEFASDIRTPLLRALIGVSRAIVG